MTEHLDRIDKKILADLQADSRRPVAEVAERCGLSKSACHRRIKLLQDQGVIERYMAVLNARALGYSLIFVVEVTLQGQSEESMRDFEKAVLRIPEVLECQLMTGQQDYILRVAARSAEDYEHIHHRLARLPGVATLQSSLALRTVKAWTGLPL